MPDTKITALTAIGANPIIPATFPIPMVDLTDTSMAASGTTKKVTVNQILGAGGTATLASATITGDLTVDTSTLKVDSANNFVAIGTVSGFNLAAGRGNLTVGGSSSAIINLSTASADSGNLFHDGTEMFLINRTASGPLSFQTNLTTRYSISSTGIATWSNVDGVAGTAMTLNATGLGVGGAPLSGFRLNVNNGDFRVSDVQNEDGVEIGWSAGGSNGFVQAYNRTTSAFKDLVLNAAVTINAAGNCGIGVTPSAWVSYQKSIDFGGAGNYGSVSARANFAAFATNCYFDGTNWVYKNNNPANLYEHSAGLHIWRYAAAGTGNITFTQAMTLDASGNLLVGVTAAPSGTIGGSGFIADSNSRKQLHLATTASTSQVLAVFINPNGTVGTIETNGSSTAYNISSDYRLKEEVKPLTGALNRITALKPSTYKWKVDGSVGEGFIAHELAEVVPFAVSGQKDAVNADGSIKTQGVDLSKIVPILVAAIQELTARVQTLETR